MALIDRVKERTGTDLSDTELQDMIDAITGDLNARLGFLGETTIELGDPTDPVSRYMLTVRLTRPLDTALPVTVIEREPSNSGFAEDEITLSVNDYRVLHSGRTLQRLTTGDNGRDYWAPLVTITYTPLGNAGRQAARDEATIKIMMLDLSYRGGLKSEKAGDYSFTLSGDMAADREAIIESLTGRSGMVMG